MVNNSTVISPKFGDVFLVEFDGKGSVQSGIRPAIIFQNNIGNIYSPNVTVIPLTSKIKKTNLPTHVFLPAKDTGLAVDSMALCENPVCISKDKLGRLYTSLPEKYMSKVAEANILASAAIAYINPEILLAIQEKALRLNKN